MDDFTPTHLATYNWKNSHILILIQAYNTHKNKFSNINYKSKNVWKIIGRETEQQILNLGETIVSTKTQIINKWKALTYNYRKYVDEQNHLTIFQGAC